MDQTVIPLTITAEKDENCNLRVLVSSAAVTCGCVRCPDGRTVCGCPPRCPEFVSDGDPFPMDVNVIIEEGRVVDIQVQSVGQSQST